MLQVRDPVQVSGQLGDGAIFVGIGQLLFVVVEARCQSTLGIVVHFICTHLKLNGLSTFGDDCGVQTLVAVWFWL